MGLAEALPSQLVTVRLAEAAAYLLVAVQTTSAETSQSAAVIQTLEQGVMC